MHIMRHDSSNSLKTQSIKHFLQAKPKDMASTDAQADSEFEESAESCYTDSSDELEELPQPTSAAQAHTELRTLITALIPLQKEAENAGKSAIVWANSISQNPVYTGLLASIAKHSNSPKSATQCTHMLEAFCIEVWTEELEGMAALEPLIPVFWRNLKNA